MYMQSPGGFGLMWICIESKEQGMKGKKRIQERKDSSAAALYIRLYKKNREVRVGWFSPGRDPQHQRLVPPWLALASRWWFLHLSFIFLCCFFLFCFAICYVFYSFSSEQPRFFFIGVVGVENSHLVVFMNYRYGTTASGSGFYCFFCFHNTWSRAMRIKVKRNTFSPNASLAYFFASENGWNEETKGKS